MIGQHLDVISFQVESDAEPIPVSATAYVIRVWRAALMARSDQPVPEIISGHPPGSTPEDPSPSRRSHLALFPLPVPAPLGPEPVLLGLAAATPRSASSTERTTCLRALARVTRLTLGGLGVWSLRVVGEETAPSALRPSAWARPATEWASVTPVVLGRFPRDPFGEESRSLLRQACRIADLPEPEDLHVSGAAWTPGVPPSSRFPPAPSRPGRPRRFHVHVRVRFREVVAGPVLLGAGRHIGYGLLRPVSSSDGLGAGADGFTHRAHE